MGRRSVERTVYAVNCAPVLRMTGLRAFTVCVTAAVFSCAGTKSVIVEPSVPEHIPFSAEERAMLERGLERAFSWAQALGTPFADDIARPVIVMQRVSADPQTFIFADARRIELPQAQVQQWGASTHAWATGLSDALVQQRLARDPELMRRAYALLGYTLDDATGKPALAVTCTFADAQKGVHPSQLFGALAAKRLRRESAAPLPEAAPKVLDAVAQVLHGAQVPAPAESCRF